MQKGFIQFSTKFLLNVVSNVVWANYLVLLLKEKRENYTNAGVNCFDRQDSIANSFQSFNELKLKIKIIARKSTTL